MIGIIFEHPTWLVPLFEALDTRRIPFEPIDVSSFAYDMQSDTVLPLYVNRLSASSYQRGNQRAIALALSYLTHLTARGARVLNARNAPLEMNKVAQLLAFQHHGLLTPRTWVFNDPDRLRALPADFPFPLLVKPAQGGAGSLIQRFETRHELDTHRHSLQIPPDALMLAQAYIHPAPGYINRVEMLDGNLLYALQVYPSESFNLCPADVCDVEGEAASSARFVLNDTLDPAVVESIQTLFRALQLDFGSIEFLEAADGRRYFYDLNLNSNYRTQLPGVEHFDPWGSFADYLGAQLEAACAPSA